jgi:hypothetical protein
VLQWNEDPKKFPNQCWRGDIDLPKVFGASRTRRPNPKGCSSTLATTYWLIFPEDHASFCQYGVLQRHEDLKNFPDKR